MTLQFPTLMSTGDVLGQICTLGEGGVLAFITGVDGPSYRPVGAVMGIDREGALYGSLSSGCIEHDIAFHAKESRKSGRTKMLRYGVGSPFFDIQLPCGGGLDILLVPAGGQEEVLRNVFQNRQTRKCIALGICPQTGRLWTEQYRTTGWDGEYFYVGFQPDLQFAVFGKGPEAYSFASLVKSVGYSHTLFSPDSETINIGATLGCSVEQYVSPKLPTSMNIDPWTAVTLFFHDHEMEPPILTAALNGPAVYIGAQGSARTAANRKRALVEAGVSTQAVKRLFGPIGLVPSTRDARTLAVSVLAEILDQA